MVASLIVLSYFSWKKCLASNRYCCILRTLIEISLKATFFVISNLITPKLRTQLVSCDGCVKIKAEIGSFAGLALRFALKGQLESGQASRMRALLSNLLLCFEAHQFIVYHHLSPCTHLCDEHDRN